MEEVTSGNLSEGSLEETSKVMASCSSEGGGE